MRRKKRIVLKSPPHTARIRVLLEMFPKAKFVHIVRDPYVIFPSTVNLWKRLYRDEGLQVPTYEGLEEHVFSSFDAHVRGLRARPPVVRPPPALRASLRRPDRRSGGADAADLRSAGTGRFRRRCCRPSGSILPARKTTRPTVTRSRRRSAPRSPAAGASISENTVTRRSGRGPTARGGGKGTVAIFVSARMGVSPLPLALPRLPRESKQAQARGPPMSADRPSEPDTGSDRSSLPTDEDSRQVFDRERQQGGGIFFWFLAWVGTTSAGSLFGLWAVREAMGLVGGAILAGAVAVPVLVSFAIATWALCLTRFRVLMAGLAGAATGTLATSFTFDPIIFKFALWPGIIVAGLLGALGGAWGGLSHYAWLKRNYWESKTPPPIDRSPLPVSQDASSC